MEKENTPETPGENPIPDTVVKSDSIPGIIDKWLEQRELYPIMGFYTEAKYAIINMEDKTLYLYNNKRTNGPTIHDTLLKNVRVLRVDGGPWFIDGQMTQIYQSYGSIFGSHDVGHLVNKEDAGDNDAYLEEGAVYDEADVVRDHVEKSWFGLVKTITPPFIRVGGFIEYPGKKVSYIQDVINLKMPH